MIRASFILSNYCKVTHISSGKKCGNSAYFYDQNGSKFLLARETTYVYAKNLNGEAVMYVEPDANGIIRSNESVYQVKDGTFTFKTYLTKSAGSDWGYEDPRIVNWNHKNLVFFSRRSLTDWSKFEVNVGILTDNNEYKHLHILPSKQHIEKNWQPINDMPGKCIYSVLPFVIYDSYTGKFETKENHFKSILRGSTNIVRVGDCYIGINHIRNQAFEYLHYFVKYDLSLNLIGISKPFSFMGMPVEFTCHMEVCDGNVGVLVSVHDNILYEFNMSAETLTNLFANKLDNCVKNIPVEHIVENAYKVGNIATAVALSTYSTDKECLLYALQQNHTHKLFYASQNEQLGLTLFKQLKDNGI